MRILKAMILAISIALSATSCVPSPPAVTQTRYVLSHDGSSVTLSSETESQWYSCTSSRGSSPTLLATGTTFDTPAFQETGISYYMCSTETSSTVYIVAYSGLPVVRIDTDSGNSITSKEEWVGAHVTIQSTEYDTIDADITTKGRGNYHWLHEQKKSYNIKFDSKTSVLGMKKGKKWCLISNVYDATMMRNILGGYISSELFPGQGWIPSYTSCELVVNGEYLGNYTLAEAIKIDSKRLDIVDIEDSIESLVGNPDPDLTGLGYILEIDARWRDAEHIFTSSMGHPLCLVEPDLEDYTEQQMAPILAKMKQKIDAFETDILKSQNIADLTLEQLSAYIDVDSFASWFIVEELGKNLDSNFKTSVHLYVSSEDNLIHMGPNWDFDHAFGGIDELVEGIRCESTSGLWITTSQGDGESWYKYLLRNSAFRGKVVQILEDNKTEALSKIDAKIDELESELAVSASLNILKWPMTNFKCYPRCNSFQQHVRYLKNWIGERYTNMIEEIRDYR